MKHIKLLVCVLLTVLCASCTATPTNSGVDSPKYNQECNSTENKSVIEDVFFLSPSKYPIIQDEGAYYKVYSDEYGSGIYYVIFDKYNAVLDEGYCSWKYHKIEEKEGLLELSYGTTGSTTFNTKYYDPINGKVSRIFQSPLAVSKNDLVAYFKINEDKIYLIVQNVFDSSVFYKEFFDDNFSTAVFLYSSEAYFSETEDNIRLTYLDLSGKKQTATFNLL